MICRTLEFTYLSLPYFTPWRLGRPKGSTVHFRIRVE